MPKVSIDKKAIKTISQLSADITEVELSDPALDDADLRLFISLFPSPSKINKISIPKHCLTQISYIPLLNFLKNHPEITSLSYYPIKSSPLYASTYNGGINELLNERQKAQLEKTSTAVKATAIFHSFDIKADISNKPAVLGSIEEIKSINSKNNRHSTNNPQNK